MRYAIINAGGIVTDVINWDGVSAWSPPAETTVVQSDIANPGWAYDGSVFTAPPVTPPDPVIVAAQERFAALLADPDRQALVAAITTATPDQIKTYITNNVTDLASARAMLIRLALLVIAYIRT